MVNQNTCIVHPFRPAPEQCKKCAKGICCECARLYTGLCPSCAGLKVDTVNTRYTTTKAAVTERGKPKKRPPAKKSADSALSRLRGTPLPKVAAAALGTILVGLVALGLLGRGPFPLRTPPPTPVEAASRAKADLYFAVTCIEAHRTREGRVPKTLADVGLGHDKALVYKEITPKRYLISIRGGGEEFTYDSTQPVEVYFKGMAAPINPSVRGLKQP